MGKNAREHNARRQRRVPGKSALPAWLDDLPKRAPVPAVDDATYQETDHLLSSVIDHYLTSREFNGMPVGESAGTHENAARLIRDGLIQLVTTTDFMNTHVRPWARDDVERQAVELSEVVSGDLMGCMYPTTRAMEERGPTLTLTEPYRDRMILGHGTLEPVYFDLAAVEGYVNDPSFSFTPGDDSFRFSTNPESDYTDADLVAFEGGYAYDHGVDYQGDEPIRRYWTAFLCDLVSLPARHQTRLSTFERDSAGLFPHPDWWEREIGGRWTDTIGPFTKVMWELEAINELWEIAFETTLFSKVDRPRAWGWVLRPTTGSYNEFIHLTDKLLSENIRHKGLDAAGTPRTDDAGKTLASLTRLQELLLSASSKATLENIRDVLQPLRDVRKERQNPAHKIEDTVTDANVVNKQRDLLRDVGSTLYAIRSFVQTHPTARASDWTPRQGIDNWRWL